MEGGIAYFIEPSKGDYLVHPLPDILEKDLILSTTIIREGDNMICFKTSEYPPNTYKENVEFFIENKNISKRIYDIGEEIVQITELNYATKS